MKRWITILLVLALCLVPLGCGERSTGGSTNAGQSLPQNNMPQASVPQASDPEGFMPYNGTTLAYRADYYRECKDIFDYYSVPEDSFGASGAVVSAEEGAVTDFVAWLDSWQAEYHYASYYQLEEALEKYEAAKDIACTDHGELLQTVTAQALVERVKVNNEAYLQQEDIRMVAGMYGALSDSDLMKVCTIISDVANFYMDNSNESDRQQVLCVLSNLKIFDRPVMSNAYVGDDDCLTISSSLIGTLEIKLDSAHQDQDVYFSTIAHETIHMLQKGCKHNNEAVYRIGFAYKFSDMTMHPLFTNWFYEGAAEHMVMDCTGYMPLVYEGSIKRIHAMTLSTLLAEENSIYSVQQIPLQHSLDGLFAVFGAESRENQTELLNMMFTLQLLLIENEEYMGALPQMTDEEKSDMWQDMKSSAGLTLSKYFYRNLALLLQTQDMPLEDIFYLLTVLEQEVNSSLRLTDAHRQEVSQDMLDCYTQMQDRFFALLAESCDLTQQEITQRYLGYGLAKADNSPNYDLSYLPEDKQVFIHYLCSTNYLTGLQLRTLAS